MLVRRRAQWRRTEDKHKEAAGKSRKSVLMEVVGARARAQDNAAHTHGQVYTGQAVYFVLAQMQFDKVNCHEACLLTLLCVEGRQTER